MYLLGHTMGVKIQVVQPSALSCNNFVAHYPDEGADSYPKIYLLQEAEGHYDVLSTWMGLLVTLCVLELGNQPSICTLFIDLKPALLTQLPASNEWKVIFLSY